MSHAEFVHLRLHTAYSLSEGAIHVKDLVKQCVGHKMPAVAVTDTNNMFGALEFSKYASDAGIQPIAGVTLDCCYKTAEKSPQLKNGKNDTRPSKLILLAQSRKGYGNLMRIVSQAHLTSDPQSGVQFDVKSLEGLTDDVICLTGGVSGPVGQLLLADKREEAQACLVLLRHFFVDRLYVELTRHGESEEAQVEEAMLDLAYEHDLPIVATNQPYFVGPDMYEPHDALLCMADSTYVAATDRRKLNAEYRFKTAEEMNALFADLPEAIENTVNIAQRCHFKVEEIAPLLPNFTSGLDVSEADMLRDESIKGLRARLDTKAGMEDLIAGEKEEWEKEYWERLDFELKIINQMGFPGYFLIVADFIQWAKDHDVPVGPGRGSGAGSVVAWALKITDLDPLKFSLLFERFLNPERVSMPDFDIDFCQDKREQVIKYVQDKYGYDRVAQIITFGKLQARAVVKACGRVLQQPHGVTDRLSKMIPNDPGNAMSLGEAIESEPRLRAEIDNDELTRSVMDRALKLEGFYAHSSTHAAGVVIGDRPLDELVPLYRDPKSDMPVTQFNMKWVEQAGLVKFDFLGLKTLTVLDRAVAYARERGLDIDINNLPLDDKPSYEMLALGDSAGVFQLESTGMRSVLKGLKPDKFEDIIAIVALYRPGPMDNIPTYVDRKHGRDVVEYPHPILEDILSETYGVIIYQEQVMQIAQVMSGYSLGEADILRRAMGKKIQEEMDKQRGRFCDGAVDRGIDAEKASYIFDLVTKFASYGFNKSHAAAYALVAYQTAYMKANYPVEFMAAIMTLDMGNTDKLAAFKQELQRAEIPLLLPNINKSHVAFVVEKATEPYCEEDEPRANFAVRYALGAIKGVGEKAMEAIIDERTKSGPFKDVFDFAERIDPKLVNKRQIERLASAGAFDGLLPDRAQAFAAAEIIQRMAQMQAQERESNQVSLFAGDAAAAADRPALPIVKGWTATEQLEHEKKAIGFYLSAHPLDTYATLLERERIIPAKEVMTDPGLIGQTVRMAGAIAGYREGTSKRGNKFGRITLSDQTDAFEMMYFGDDIDHVRRLVDDGAPLVVSVQIRKRDDDDSVGLSCRSLESLEAVASQSSKGLFVEVEDASAFASIKAVLDRKSGGRGKVTIKVPVHEDARFAEFRLPGSYKISPELCQAIAAEIGVAVVEEV
ncbi:MAG: DNA polymerase III subunit alpha [Kordiimonadaceae bacterium]|nr:DNA polymerase III subunit alpha [Kordiimonadaceae bacterium]MBO6570337.1 DNA polymerase III subunit alpha [Kordiimonadaceae bacterium]MBO6965565.1 DNA polymerase III subunit alpha [Kordiimonadaceae bacterium]